MILDLLAPAGVPASDDFPLKLRRGDTATLQASGFRNDDGSDAAWIAGDVLTFTMAIHPHDTQVREACPFVSCQVIQVTGTFTVGQATATFAIAPSDWPSWILRGSFPADVQLKRASGDVFTLFFGVVEVEQDVTP